MRRVVRWVVRLSVVLLGVTLVYWGVAFLVAGTDFGNMSANARPKHVSVSLGKTEVSWVMDYYLGVVFVVSGDGAVPLVGRYGVLGAMSGEDSPVTWGDGRWDYQPRVERLIPGTVTVLRFDGSNQTTGRAVALRIVYVPMWALAAVFAVVPVMREAWGWRRRWRVVLYWRARRRRRARGAGDVVPVWV